MIERGVTLPALLLLCGILAVGLMTVGQIGPAFVLALACGAGFWQLSRIGGGND